MPLDEITLRISKLIAGTSRHGFSREITQFISYRVESDLFVAGDSFEFVLPGKDQIEIAEGDEIELYVNNELELTAIAREPQREYDKESSQVIVSGVDYMGLLVGHYLEEFTTYQNVSITTFVAALLFKVPFIKSKTIEVREGSKSESKIQTKALKDKTTSTKDIFRTKPGDTVFTAMKRFVASKGLLFFNLPGGIFIIGQPITTGSAEFYLDKTNIKAKKAGSLSQRWKKVIVLGTKQQQEGGVSSQEEYYPGGSAEDPDFPYDKPFVVVSGEAGDGDDLNRQAAMLLSQQKAQASRLEYVTYGHSYKGKNWEVNKIVNLQDKIYPQLNGDYLIYRRVFTMSKDEGSQTILGLAPLGVLPTS